MVPSGKSESSHYLFGNTLKKMTMQSLAFHCPEHHDSIPYHSVAQGIKALSKINAKAFKDVAAQFGHFAPPKMSANFWVAMSTAAELRVRQQRIINRYLSFHFGNRMCVSETEISKVGSGFVPFEVDTIAVDIR